MQLIEGMRRLAIYKLKPKHRQKGRVSVIPLPGNNLIPDPKRQIKRGVIGRPRHILHPRDLRKDGRPRWSWCSKIGSRIRAGPRLGLKHPGNMIVIGNPMVIRDLILHPQEDQGGAGNPHPQSCDIQDAEPLILPEIPDRGRQIITEHMACISRYPANAMPVLQPVRFQPLIAERVPDAMFAFATTAVRLRPPTLRLHPPRHPLSKKIPILHLLKANIMQLQKALIYSIIFIIFLLGVYEIKSGNVRDFAFYKNIQNPSISSSPVTGSLLAPSASSLSSATHSVK